MVFPNIEKIKQEYTDKYVVVDAKRPELARFANVVGQVKTVNMNGRALVEFLDYHLNTGWYDIELEFLKVVDKPEPKAKEEKKAAPPKSEAKKPEATIAAPASKPTTAGKPSTADILAKLRGGGGGGPATPAKKTDSPKPKAEAPATSPSGGEGSPAKIDRSKMSVADMLAAARAGGSKPAPTAAAAGPVQEAPSPGPSVPEHAEGSAQVAEAPAPAAPSAPATTAEGGVVKIDKTGMSIAEMIAYCREKDSQ